MSDRPEEPTTRRIVDVLRQWEHEVDAQQRAHLVAARRRALASTESRRYRWPAWGGAAAALLLLGLGLGMIFWPQAAIPPDAALLQATLEANPLDFIDAQDAELLLDEDLDFYLWLIGDTEAT